MLRLPRLSQSARSLMLISSTFASIRRVSIASFRLSMVIVFRQTLMSHTALITPLRDSNSDHDILSNEYPIPVKRSRRPFEPPNSGPVGIDQAKQAEFL